MAIKYLKKSPKTSSTDDLKTIEIVQNDLKKIDYKGSFESDDETGIIFEQIKDTINQLESYRGEDVDAS